MISKRFFLVGVGQQADDQLRVGAAALSATWGGALLELSCEKKPQEMLSGLKEQKEGLIYLSGDPAMTQPGGCWLEALASWHMPTVLMVIPFDSGLIPGSATAYVALCKLLSVPLLGVLQVGGLWNPNERRADFLPWRGWIPINCRSTNRKEAVSSLDSKTYIQEASINLHTIMLNID